MLAKNAKQWQNQKRFDVRVISNALALVVEKLALVRFSFSL
jgi:hypothetical protein